VHGSTGEIPDESVEVESVPAAAVLPEPAESPERETKAPPKPSKPAGPPSDRVLQKKLVRRIRAKCGQSMATEPVHVSFFVTEGGEISLLNATPRNAAGQCAKQQVQGTKFRERKAVTPIKIVVE
jgi:hypothetical protein